MFNIRRSQMITPMKICRLSKGIKLQDVAKAIGKSISLISKIENGKAQGSRKTRGEIASFFSIPANNLFGGK